MARTAHLDWQTITTERHLVVTMSSGQREPLCGFTGVVDGVDMPCRGCLDILYRSHDEAFPNVV